jgi:glycosyltransferase involved in cell wall biosynthesis
MRILHVISCVDAKHGGPPMVASRLAAAQVTQGCRAGLLSYEPDSEKTSIPASLPGIPGGPGVEVILAGRRTGMESFTARRARAAIRAAIDRYDLLHLNGVWDPILLAAAKEARHVGKPYVLTPHGMLDPWALSQRKAKKRLAMLLGVRRMLNEAAFLHLLNPDELALIKPLGLKTPGEIIPNGVFLEEFSNLPARGSFYASHPELQGQPFILFLSRLHFKKGLDYLAGAFAILAPQRPDLRLVVAGADDGYLATFQRMVAEHRLTDRTHVVGALYGRDKLAAFVDAAAFCLPSRQEGFSIAITEALACGTPAVVTDACHFPEVQEAGAGACTALDAAAVAQGLAAVLDQDRQRLGAAGQQLVRTRFTWPLVARRSMEAYAARALGPAALASLHQRATEPARSAAPAAP